MTDAPSGPDPAAYADLKPTPYTHTTGYYDHLTHEELVTAIERRDRTIRTQEARILSQVAMIKRIKQHMVSIMNTEFEFDE